MFGKRLFQPFLVDTYSTIESLILKWFKTHQNEKTEIYKGVLEAILRGETDPLTLGRRIVLSSSFVGGARYMHKNYQYVLTIYHICMDWIPNLFMTFTCNH